MIEVADVFRRFGPDYLKVHGASMLPSHRRAITDLMACRTEALGGHLWRCTECSAEVHSYHSCKNRSCPKCHANDTASWLAARKAEMLPTHHFHVTVTVPEELRRVMRANQVVGYGLLMTSVTRAILDLARDSRYVGGSVGVLAVLHTWTRQLEFHPHVHCLVTGGGVSQNGDQWYPAKPDFLFPVKALAKLVRGKLRAGLTKAGLADTVPDTVWTKPWVVHCTPWGDGEQAVLDYLARYVFRTALTNSRIIALDDHGVTFKVKPRDGDTEKSRTCRLTGPEFIRRFLQHVLPSGFHKVRYCGLWHHSKRSVAARVSTMLRLERPSKQTEAAAISETSTLPAASPDPTPRACPKCDTGHLVLVRRISPIARRFPLGP